MFAAGFMCVFIAVFGRRQYVRAGDTTTVASISAQQRASCWGNANIPTAKGNLSGDSNFLQVTWANPGFDQSSQYTCTINTTDSGWRVILFNSNIYVYYLRPETDMIKYVTELEGKLSQLQIAVQECKQNCTNDARDIRSAQNTSQSYLQEQIDSLKAQDTDTGSAEVRVYAITCCPCRAP